MKFLRGFTNYYKNNRDYCLFLSHGKTAVYKKYIDVFKDIEGPILDVGCGTGQVVTYLAAHKKEAYGIDVSPLFLKQAQKKSKGKFSLYDGTKFPYKNNFFSAVGSFNVLEHTENPAQIIREMVRVTKQGGLIVLACPNFLCVISQGAHHWHTKGLKMKMKNALLLIKKTIIMFFYPNAMHFDFMKAIVRPKGEFLPDDDAISITNPIDCRFFLKKNRVRIKKHSSFLVYTQTFHEFLGNIPLLNYLFGGVFIVGEKL